MKLALLLILLLASLATGQKSELEPCPVRITDAPSLRGFELGQSLASIEERLPGFRDAYLDASLEGEFGYVIVHSFKIPDPVLAKDNRLSDVDFTVHFLDEKIVLISLNYSAFDAESLDSFILSVNETTRIPIKAWKKEGKNNARVICYGFSADLWTGRNEQRSFYQAYPNFMISDNHKDAEMARRKKDKDAREKKAFLDKKKAENEALQIQEQRERQEAERRKIFKP